MRKRFQIIILICVLCTMLVGCGSSDITIPVDSIKESLETYGFIPVDDSFSTFYDTYDNQVYILDYHKDHSNTTVELNNLKVDGKAVYYDTENNCFTTEPILKN